MTHLRPAVSWCEEPKLYNAISYIIHFSNVIVSYVYITINTTAAATFTATVIFISTLGDCTALLYLLSLFSFFVGQVFTDVCAEFGITPIEFHSLWLWSQKPLSHTFVSNEKLFDCSGFSRGNRCQLVFRNVRVFLVRVWVRIAVTVRIEAKQP